MSKNIRIAMFSGPRNISTTLMRAFENRPDTRVIDEPFYACYLKETGADHPMREAVLASQPTVWQDVVSNLGAHSHSENVVFEKHIAFHFVDGAPLDWVKDTRAFILIRDPCAMVASYKNKYDDVSPIIESFKIQRHIYDGCIARDVPCPVVDASDILNQPSAMIHILCANLRIPFSPTMLSWPEGPRETDGVWAAHWYDAVQTSTGFRQFRETAPSLSADLEAVAEKCRPDYEFFHKRRIQSAKEAV